MQKKMSMYKLGLVGTPLTHSFSKKYFENKFNKEKIDNFSYNLYDLKNIRELDIICNEGLVGLNVTQPYKKQIIQHLDELDVLANKTQSVNTVFINPKTKKKIGYNTDIIGFEKLLQKISLHQDIQALILGSGGVSNTISYVLNKKQITYSIVSRKPKYNMLSYQDINNVISDFKLIINTTPVGQYPNINTKPILPYHLISNKHHFIDLIYNPKKTMFLKTVEKKGATIINGQEMFVAQAEASFKIWTKCLKKI